MARMISPVVLSGESREQLGQIASDDLYIAQQGYVDLRRGDGVWLKHIDELTREDHLARIEFERELVGWLRGRIEANKKIEARLGGGEAESERWDSRGLP